MHALKKIDVFMDLEGVGLSERVGNGLKRVEFVAHELPVALRREGYELATVTGFACYKRPFEIVPPLIQTSVRNVFVRHGWNMFWGDGIADSALIHNAENRLANGVLSEVVMLVANDHDFCRLAYKLRASGRLVCVSGHDMSKRLKKVADRVFPFWELLGGHPERVSPERPLHRAQDTQPINSFPMPDIEIHV